MFFLISFILFYSTYSLYLTSSHFNRKSSFLNAVTNFDISNEMNSILLSDYDLIDDSDVARSEITLESHILHDTLNGDGLIETYTMYRKRSDDEIRCVVKLGGQLNGYPGIVHGGVTALLFDNSFAWAIIALRNSPGVTESLNISYKYVYTYPCMHCNVRMPYMHMNMHTHFISWFYIHIGALFEPIQS